MTIELPDSMSLSEEDFFEFCRLNRDLRIERTAKGEIIVMSPTGGETGSRGAEITMQLRQWAKKDGTGVAFDSSTGFRLPNGAERSPDAAWLSRSRLAQLTSDQKRKFLPLCPDFVIELMSPSDTLNTVQSKMEEYIDNGSLLGWLIAASARRVHVYKPGVAPEILESLIEMSADPILPGFILEMSEIWEPTICRFGNTAKILE
ncbi:MAG TPA: Uma2 family endonuclease [Blastocatellia bacterium]